LFASISLTFIADELWLISNQAGFTLRLHTAKPLTLTLKCGQQLLLQMFKTPFPIIIKVKYILYRKE
jgi:hypothetical protein